MVKRKASLPPSVRSGVRLKRSHLSQYKKNWWGGAFKKSVWQNYHAEWAYKYHKKGSYWPPHYQKVAWEYNLVTHGKLQIGAQIFKEKDIFIVPPMVITAPKFLTDCEVMVVKTPSIPGDKVIVRRNIP